jgi:complex III assembly factor LYRM7
MALAAYRHLLRSTRIAFQGTHPLNLSRKPFLALIVVLGDLPTLMAARRAARDNFDQNRTLASSEEMTKSIQHAEDVAKILREQVIQGKAVDGDENRFSAFYDW